MIPIENIYYMFCYAWNRFEEGKAVPVEGVASPNLPNLLAKVLLFLARAILRRGLRAEYSAHSDDIKTVRGHIVIGESMRHHVRNVRKLHCEFDELTVDNHLNRILKASLKRLAAAPNLERAFSSDLRSVARRMEGVSDTKLERSAFKRMYLHRHNSHYAFLLEVAELAFDCLLPSDDGRGYVFHDVVRNETAMAKVFEEFVRNFYRIEQKEFAVEPLTIRWDAAPVQIDQTDRLPKMVVDVFLQSATRKIIIDTKYYASAFQSYHGGESFRSGNLYQIYSYIKNKSAIDASFRNAEGILLYPEVQRPIDATYLVQGHRIRIATVNLAQSWNLISERLLELLMANPERGVQRSPSLQ